MALGTVVALGAGCTDVGSPFFIVQNAVPEEGCIVSASLGQFRARGIIDANAGAGYLFTPVAQNTATAEDVDNEGLRIVFVEGADINISIQSGFPGADNIPSEQRSFSRRFSGAIQPGGFTAFAFTIISKELLTEYLLPSMGADEQVELGVEISMFGKYAGSDITAQPFNYWVDVCNGCMKQNVGMCADLPTNYEGSPGGACVLLQDTPLECCTLDNGGELCPAESTAEGGL